MLFLLLFTSFERFIDVLSLTFRGMETLQGAPGSGRAITVQEKS